MKLFQNMMKLTLLALTCAVYLVSAGNSYAGKLYKWVDADGRISYQDQPPPENAKILSEDTVKISGKTQSRNEEIGPVVVYTIENCDPCKTILSRLVELGIPVDERSMQNDRAAQKWILDRTNGLLVAPTVVIGEALLVNASDDDLLTNLGQAGYSLPEVEKEEEVGRLGVPETDDFFDNSDG